METSLAGVDKALSSTVLRNGFRTKSPAAIIPPLRIIFRGFRRLIRLASAMPKQRPVSASSSTANRSPSAAALVRSGPVSFPSTPIPGPQQGCLPRRQTPSDPLQGGRTGNKSLQTASVSTSARRSGRIDHRMPQFSGGKSGAVQQTTFIHHPCPHPGPHMNTDKGIRPPSVSKPTLPHRSGTNIIFHFHGNTEFLLQNGTEGKVREGGGWEQIGRHLPEDPPDRASPLQSPIREFPSPGSGQPPDPTASINRSA